MLEHAVADNCRKRCAGTWNIGAVGQYNEAIRAPPLGLAKIVFPWIESHDPAMMCRECDLSERTIAAAKVEDANSREW